MKINVLFASVIAAFAAAAEYAPVTVGGVTYAPSGSIPRGTNIVVAVDPAAMGVNGGAVTNMVTNIVSKAYVESLGLSGVDTNAVRDIIADSPAGTMATNTFTKAETERKISEAQPGDYANVSNRAMRAVQNESDPGFTAWIGNQPLAPYASKEWVGQQGFLTEHQSLQPAKDYADTTATNEAAKVKSWVNERRGLLVDTGVQSLVVRVTSSNLWLRVEAYTNDVDYVNGGL